MLDLSAVRAQFPALDSEWALLDNAGGSAPCRAVIAAVSEHLARRPVQLGATYRASREASAAVEAGRTAMALLGGVDPGRTVIGPSATVLLQRLAAGMRRSLRPGDEIVVTNLDHEANIGPWRGLERDGAVLREWRFRREDCALHVEDLVPLLNQRTRLVAFGQVSNLVGTIHDVAAACARVRAAGAVSVVDGVAYAPHRRPLVDELGADAYVFSAYKVFGPHQAVLFARRELLERWAPEYHFFLQDPVRGFEPAGGAYELVASLPGIVEHLAGLAPCDGTSVGERLDAGYAAIGATEARLAAPLLAFLAAHPRVELLGTADPDPARRVPTISFSVAGRRSSEITLALDEHLLGVRHGHFHAWRAVRDLGLLERDGVVRVSLAHYNTEGEVERLMRALDLVL